MIFWKALQFKIAMPQLLTFHMDLHPPTHVQLKTSKDICLGHVAFKCHAKFQINWESFAHRDRQKNLLRKCCS